ncbi:uncharacterized protein LOC111865904 [Cryptotermes secundus]|uniref:uncharacterized protein LOC111865904 n=1 Tax=Cryptotermes secundus TaxID=105785 RepID=UPI001454C40D|nr:uncharacterized protein LOC111865904 [Cryptotermes secundus]
MLSLLANDYLAHTVELLEAEERTSEMMQNISMDGDATAIPEAPGKQTVPSSTNTSQEILEYHEETMIATSVPFTYQAGLNGGSKTSYDYICLSTQRQPSYATKDLANGSLSHDIHTEDCLYSEGRRYDFVDVASTSFICTTPYTYQGY